MTDSPINNREAPICPDCNEPKFWTSFGECWSCNCKKASPPDKLMVCPFCGNEPKIFEWEKSKFVTQNGNVCPEVWFIGCDCFFVKSYAHHGTKAEAIDKWNTRA